jgi:proteasome lid subunit RPN8/RPN11
MLRIGQTTLDQIRAHMEEIYPHECCGLIYGRVADGVRAAEGARRCGNLNTERAVDRYELDPMDMLRCERELEGTGQDIIGVYHSHPDHPSRPSVFDRDHAWPGWSYMIGSVMKGRVVSVQSWELDEGAKRFEEESIDLRQETQT